MTASGDIPQASPAEIREVDGLDDRVPFLARLEKADRASLPALGHELSFAPRVVLVHQSEPSSHVLFLVQAGPGSRRRPSTATRCCSRCAAPATS